MMGRNVLRELELYNIKSIEQLVRELESLEPLQVNFHSDADGIGACALLACAFEIEESKEWPRSPAVFGGYRDGHIALDLGAPLFRDKWKGKIVIDHHDHIGEITYKLVLGSVPTGLMIYKLFKDRIPAEKTWLAVLSCVGDGQPEIIPDEIWDTVKELWDMQGNIYMDRYKNIKSYPYPLFSKLSSPVNALCRTGDVMGAYSIVRSARSLRDVINNPKAIRAQNEISSEIDRIFNDSSNPLVIEKIGHFAIVRFRSKSWIASRVATMLQSSDRYVTYLVINETNREVSIRGIQAKYLANKLASIGYLCGGHYGFAACTLLPNQDIESFVSRLRKVLSML